MRHSILIALLSFAPCVHAHTGTTTRAIDLSVFRAEIGNRQVVFIAKELITDTIWISNAKTVNLRHAPWSSFKIAHLLIALESGAVQSPTMEIPWDSKRFPAQAYWPKEWAQPQTLETAFSRSVAWYFQTLVPKIGPLNYKKWLDRFQYGNQTVPFNADNFWLGGPLLISPAEQVNFLSCLLTAGCGVSPTSVQVLDNVAFQSQKGDFKLYGKTGSGPVHPGDFDGPFEGWFVGYIRGAASRPAVAFALYTQTENYSSLAFFRQEMARRLLTHVNLWPR